jgi:hypothetical protein
MAAALSRSQVAVVRSTSIGGSVTAEASPRAGAFFLELVLDEPARDVVRFLDGAWLAGGVQLLDAVCSPDEARGSALLELRLVFLGEVPSSQGDYLLVWAWVLWPVGLQLPAGWADCTRCS